MSASTAAEIGLADPEATWKVLSENGNSLLIDVRTRAEWTFVGAPDPASLGGRVAFVEWTGFPGGARNPAFFDAVEEARAETGANRLFFLCRSGARSEAAAIAVAARFARKGESVECVNVIEGFEGDLDEEGRRGRRNGWKARGLPWRQS